MGEAGEMGGTSRELYGRGELREGGSDGQGWGDRSPWRLYVSEVMLVYSLPRKRQPARGGGQTSGGGG